MNIDIRSRNKAEQYSNSRPWACISISTPGSDRAKIPTENRVDLLQIQFKDVDLGVQDGGLSKEQAVEIWDFVHKNHDDVDTILVHCEAGMSRSPAIAAAIFRVIGRQDDGIIFQRYTPNRFVYRTMLEAARNLESLLAGG